MDHWPTTLDLAKKNANGPETKNMEMGKFNAHGISKFSGQETLSRSKETLRLHRMVIGGFPRRRLGSFKDD